MRVADSLKGSWVHRFLPALLWPYAQLARWERPIGWWLLLWPAWWSLSLVLIVRGEDALSSSSGVLFVASDYLALLIGAMAMRGAGCTYNDLVDEDIDAKVARTASRPIPSGRVSRGQARLFAVLQALVGFAALLWLCRIWGVFKVEVFVLALASLAVVAFYPFAKRLTDWPQFVLGLAFSWGALMGWVLHAPPLEWPSLMLYAGSIFWVIGYDTIYAHQDREDDALIGVRSTARLFGENTKTALILLYSIALGLFAAAFAVAGAPWPAFAGLLAGAFHMRWQIARLDIDNADRCLTLFRSNHHFGAIILAGLLASLFFVSFWR